MIARKTWLICLIIFNTALSGQHHRCSFLTSTSHFDHAVVRNIELIKFTEDCFKKLNVIPPSNLLIFELKGEDNCYATTYMNRPVLAFDVEWLNNIRSSSDWSSIFVIGHEIGHLIENHTLELPDKEQEIEADTWGALLISSFGYPHSNFNRDFPKILLDTQESKSHPSGVRRLNHINKILANTDKNILSSFGSITFHIDRWNSESQTQFAKLEDDLNALALTANKSNLIRVIESLNYCERFIDNKEELILDLLEYGIVLNEITFEEAYKYIKALNYLSNEFNHSIKLHRIFSHSSSFHYFIKLVDIKILRDQIAELSIEQMPNRLKTEVLKICVSLKIHENEDVSLENLMDLDAMIKTIKSHDYEKDIDYYDALIIYNNLIGDYNTSEIHATKSYNLWYEEFNLRNSVEIRDSWSRENLCLSLYNLGLVKFRQQKYNDALSIFEKAQLFSERPYIINDINYMIARTYFSLKIHSKALEYISKVTIEDDAFELMVRGQILLANGKKDDAKYFFNKSCELFNSWSCAKLKHL